MESNRQEGDHVTEDEKHESGSKETFLNNAARAVGSTLGKLAAKTGLAHPGEKPKASPPKSSTPGKKNPVSKAAKLVRKPVAKKTKTVAKKTSRLVTKTKR
jgi:hypothetical protein